MISPIAPLEALFSSTRRLLIAAAASLLVGATPWTPAGAQEPPADHSARRVRVAVALGGGGTRGYAHIGVLRVFKEHGIPVDCIAGTSIGSVIAGMYASGLSTDEIERLLKDRSFYDAYESMPGKLGLVAHLPSVVLPRAISHNTYDGLFKGDKFAMYIDNHLPAGQRTIEGLKMPFCAVAFDLLDGKSCSIRQGDLGRAIQASCAIPELRQPVSLNGKLFVDGGVVDNLPCQQARALGADKVIAVNVDEVLLPVNQSMFRPLGSVSDRCVTANLSQLDEMAEKQADLVIHPQVTGIKLLSRSNDDMERAIKAGEKAALEALPQVLALVKQSLAAGTDGAAQSPSQPPLPGASAGTDR